MKIGITSSPSIASESLTKSTMGMSEKGMDIAAYFLRDKIYNDKVLACIREYTCNAIDEHVKHNIDRAVIINMKKPEGSSKYVWSVRDYAKGLDENGVRNIFGMYFESTKNHSNEYVGGFGIGSKAAHSYTDSFYITSHHNGLASMYACVLGGGERGVPIGEIYKISEEPTDESGLEVSFELDYRDNYDFQNKTSNFVKRLHHNTNIEFHYDDALFDRPMQPLQSKSLGIYSLYQYEKFPSTYYNSNSLEIRMGGVVYRKINTTTSLDFDKCYIVDVPIGKLTIPISRENIEETASNQKVIEEILKSLGNFKEDKILEVGPRKFKDYVYLNNYKSVRDEWFVHTLREIAPELYTALTNCDHYEIINKDDLADTANTKLKIYKLPNIKSVKNWKLRLAQYLKSVGDYKGFTWTNHEAALTMALTSDKIDMSDIEIVDVKTLKLPKLAKDGTGLEYNVFQRHSKIGKFTSESLEEYVDNRFGKLEDDWLETIDSEIHLEYRTICLEGYHCTCLCSKSKKLVEELLENGWLSPVSEEYKKAKERIAKSKEFAQKQNTVGYELNKYIRTAYNERMVKNLKKYPDKVYKVNNLLMKLKNEQSFRGRMISNLDRFGLHVDRSDLRKILKTPN